MTERSQPHPCWGRSSNLLNALTDGHRAAECIQCHSPIAPVSMRPRLPGFISPVARRSPRTTTSFLCAAQKKIPERIFSNINYQKSAPRADLEQLPNITSVGRDTIEGRMRKAALILATVAALGVGAVASPAPAQARGGFGWWINCWRFNRRHRIECLRIRI
jgi:hypothetical protein